GGAMVEAALGPIAWNSAGVWTETIGGLKLTRATKEVKQVVTGLMKVTVGGLVTRKAPLTTIEVTGASVVTSLGPITLDSRDTLAWSGKGGLKIEAQTGITLSGGDGASVVELGTDTI